MDKPKRVFRIFCGAFERFPRYPAKLLVPLLVIFLPQKFFNQEMLCSLSLAML